MNHYAVRVIEVGPSPGSGESLQYSVESETPQSAVIVAMLNAVDGHGSGKCLCRVYNRDDDSHFPPGPVLYEAYAERDFRTNVVTVEEIEKIKPQILF